MISLRIVSSSFRASSLLLAQASSSSTSSTTTTLALAHKQTTNPRNPVFGPQISLPQTRTLSITSVQDAIGSLKLSQKSRKALQENDLSMPVRPKKPMTAYLMFVCERKDALLRDNKMTAAEMAVILSKEWKTADRSKYEQEYLDRKAEYNMKLQDYENSLTESQREFLENKKSLVKEKKLLRELRKTKPPRLPRNAANLFCAERLKDPTYVADNRSGKQSQVLSQLFQEYRSLSEEEKKTYQRMMEEDKIRFQQEFNQWFDGIFSDTSLPKPLRKRAEAMRNRYKLLSYI